MCNIVDKITDKTDAFEKKIIRYIEKNNMFDGARPTRLDRRTASG